VALSMWRLWWAHERHCGSAWGAVGSEVARAARPSALRGLAEELAAQAVRGGGHAEGAVEALAKVAEAPAACANVETALALVEALQCCAEDSSDAPTSDKAAAIQAAGALLLRAAAAHPTSGQLALMAAAQDPAQPAPRGATVAALARSSRPQDAGEAAKLLLLAELPEADASHGAAREAKRTSAGAVGGAVGRSRVLQAMLRNLARDAPAGPIVFAHVAEAAVRGGAADVEVACDEVREVAAQLWDQPARRSQTLGAALTCELRCLGAAMMGGTLPAGGSARLAGRLVARFEELLAQLDDRDPEKEDWWIQYMEFAHQASQWGSGGDGSVRTGDASRVPRATDLHVRAMRSVGDQASFGEKAQRLLQQQGGAC